MGKVSSLLLLLLVAGAVVAVTWRRPAAVTASAASSDVASALSGTAAADHLPPEAAASDAGDVADEPIEVANDAGVALPNGSRAPNLPADAPKQVTFGLVLVRYAGAEGARPGARTKEQALSLANELVELAGSDFKAAVQRGDKGSTENAGTMPRGVLEPAPEFVLFTLPKGAVGGPVDAPTGYWIVRRAD